MGFVYKKIIYGNYRGSLKELKDVGLGCYLLTMELLAGGVLKLQIYDPENIRWE